MRGMFSLNRPKRKCGLLWKNESPSAENIPTKAIACIFIWCRWMSMDGICSAPIRCGAASLGDALTIFGVLMTLMLILMNVLLYSGRRVFSQNIKTLIRLAYEDPITGAKNTAHFGESFQQILETKQPFSTAALNVHNFKGINDLFGRMRGDRVLCYMENVLNHNLKEGEFFCRDTADLFYLLLLDTDEESIKKRLAVIIEQIRASSLEYG